MAFTRNEVDGIHFFDKGRFQGFIYEILREVSPLGEELIFSTPLRQPKLEELPNFLANFIEQFESCFYFKYSRSYKVLKSR